MGNAHLEFVEQPRFQCLLDRARPVKGNTFLAGQLLCFGNRALDAVGDEVEVCLAFLHGFSRLRLQDNHRPVRGRAIGKDPALLTVDHIEASVSHDYRAVLAHRTAHDFMELFHGVSHPGENL